MADWKSRLQDEEAELRIKYVKLGAFIESCDWRARDMVEQYQLLVEQFDCMGNYLAILVKRLELTR